MGRFVLAVMLAAGAVGGFGSALASFAHKHKGWEGGHCHRHRAPEISAPAEE